MKLVFVKSQIKGMMMAKAETSLQYSHRNINENFDLFLHNGIS
jgi:hypothetical protein